METVGHIVRIALIFFVLGLGLWFAVGAARTGWFDAGNYIERHNALVEKCQKYGDMTDINSVPLACKSYFSNNNY